MMKINHACLVCGIPFGTVFGLCPHCAPRLFALREPAVRCERGLDIRSLFDWRRDGWPALRSVSARLKGQESPDPWTELAAWFLQGLEFTEGALIVPVPSLKKNHALGWARALSGLSGLAVEDCLRKLGSEENKALGRSERQNLRFGQRASPVKYYTNVIIVDDIVTTGATARAAYQALGRPRNCEVWCLMDRRPWQGEGALL